ncbi:hypothetical protein MIR68_002303 [Amoeboaphelidium protococcarum]|nr:hypothetical protein MIR68_002303 [Amoeboaphelidium protococcarum]KAI3650744.1 hypothetical protein MP228_004225 [Amoeboaphelidium protococcarum]KAI3652341.1 hypothetical protein MP228_003644 [Amoeboaphelidium protococcarum]
MTRGDQRERDRLKAQKKKQQSDKGKREDNLTPQQRRELDAKKLQEKIAAKAAQKDQSSSQSGKK